MFKSLQSFARRLGVNSERVNAAGELGGERRIDHAMALQPALPAERLSHDIEPEVGLAARASPGMAGVLMGLVFDPHALRREGLLQLFGNPILGSHVLGTHVLGTHVLGTHVLAG